MSGLILRCDPRGGIIAVLRDDLGLSASLNREPSLFELLSSSSTALVFGFLEEVNERHAAFDWVLASELGGETIPLHFAGSRRGDELRIVASSDRAELSSLFRELQREPEGFPEETAEEGTAWKQLYDDLTRLNNEMANLQRQLAKQNSELEKLNEMKNQFLGMAAHDLRNPLGVVMAYGKFLLEEVSGKLTPEQAEFVSIIYNSSQYMLRLVDDFLDVARIESGRLELEKEPTDLAVLLEHNVRLNRVLAERKGITLEFEPPAGIPELMLDSSKIEQVMNNLITNAVKFSLPDSEVRVEMWRKESEVRVAVIDRGQGIPSGEMDKLFKPFEQTSVKSTAGEKGTGLGLAIVRRIVEGHGGRIWVESEEGGGSAFYFSLTLADSISSGKEVGNGKTPAHPDN